MKKLYLTLCLFLTFGYSAFVQAQGDCLILQGANVAAAAGSTVCIDVSVKNFTNIAGMQYTMQWDTAVLAFQSVENILLDSGSEGNFGMPAQTGRAGLLTFFWFPLNNPLLFQSLPDHSVIYSVCFEVIGEAGDLSLFSFTNVPTEAVVTINNNSGTFPEHPAIFYSGSVTVGGDPADLPVITSDSCPSAAGCQEVPPAGIVAESSGGTVPYSYHWEGPAGFTAQTAVLNELQKGVYRLTVTDAAGLTAQAMFFATTSTTLGITGINITPLSDCSDPGDGAIDFSVSGGSGAYNYEWSDGATTATRSGLGAGLYAVTITDQLLGCSTSRSFSIKDEEFITGSSYECIVSGQTILAKVSTIVWGGGTPPYTFSWSNGDVVTDPMLGSTTVSLPATLTVTITDSMGCTTVPEPITPECTGQFSDVFSTASHYACLEAENGGPSMAEITYYVWEGGAGPYTFSWSTGETLIASVQSTIIVPADAVSSYTVTVTDQTGLTHVSAPIRPLCQIDGAPLVIDLGEAQAEAGESVCLPVTVQNFNNISGLQFSLSWDPAELRGDSVTNLQLPSFSGSNYNFGPFAGSSNVEGLLTVVWINSQGLGTSLADGTTLFEVCFTAIGEAGSADVIISNHPTPVEASTPVQVIPVITENGSVMLTGNSALNSVWPGDTDNNGVVDHFDLLNIGLGFGTEGFPRPEPSLHWQAQFGAPWPETTENTLVNYRHIDTDGSGAINSADTLALALNYQLFNEQWAGEDGYNKRENLPPAARSTGAPIYVDTYPVEEGGSPVFDVVLGDDENEVTSVYGLAFSIDYDPIAVVPGSIKMSFGDSWLGQEGEDLLTFYRVDQQNHKVHVALTRIDGLDVSGKGPIAQILITIEDVIFRSTDYDISISVENARLITSQEELVTVIERNSVITVSSTTQTIDPKLDRQIRVFPVPANEILFLKTPLIRVESIMLYDLEGREVRQWSGHPAQLSVSGLPQGAYILRVITEEGVAVRRVVLMNR